MSRPALSVILALPVFVTGAAFAQQPVTNAGGLFQPVEAAALDAHKLQMAEDIEVMRRLLDRTVRDLYQATPKISGFRMSQSGDSAARTDELAYSYYYFADADGSPRRGPAPEIREPIGTYLNGHGVVYQLELPPPAAPRDNVSDRTMAECPFMALSKWERTRKHLKGEWKNVSCKSCHDADSAGWKSAEEYFRTSQTVPDQAKSNALVFLKSKASASPPSRQELTDRLIDLLAENGHQFRLLHKNLTIAVTFRKPQPPAAMSRGMSGMMGEMMGGAMGGAYEMMGEEAYGESMEGEYGDSGEPALGGGDYDSFEGEEGYEGGEGAGYGGGFAPPKSSSGGKSGKSPKPSSGYGIAGGASGYGAGIGYGAGMMPDNAELAGDLHIRQGNYRKAIEEYEKALRKFPDAKSLLQKLSQAYIAAGDFQKGKTLLEKLLKRDPKAKPAEKPDDTPGVSLPARLVISVSKQNLDAVAAGKISREEFRKTVAVGYFDPEAVDAKEEDKQSQRR